MPNPIGQRIREVRQAIGMSQTDLAKDVSISRQGLNNIERGRSLPSLEIVGRIAQALQVTSDYLLGLTDNKDIPALSCRGMLASVTGETSMPALAPTLP